MGRRQRLISPCSCSGSVSKVHASCLERWIEAREAQGADALVCEICHTPYEIVVRNKVVCDCNHALSCTAINHCCELLVILLSLVMMGMMYSITKAENPGEG